MQGVVSFSQRRDQRATLRYFSLKPDAFLVRGASRGALYDLASGEVYSIDPLAARVIEACERQCGIEETVAKVQEAPLHEILDFLRRVAEAGMGEFGEQPSPRPKIDLVDPCRKLDFIWFELREDCNLRCRHCYCMSQADTGAKNRLTHEEWRRLLLEGAQLECRAVQFIGGEPFLYGDRLFDLAGRARELGYSSVGVFSNLTFLKDEWIDRLVDLRMEVSCSLYSKRPEIHDLVTKKSGSFERLMRNVARLKERGIQPRFAVTVMKHNQDYVRETMEFVRELGMEAPGFDLVRPSGRGNDDELVPDKLSKTTAYKTRAEFMRTDRATFIRRCHGNSCWQGKIAISSTGDVNPCIMQRDHPCGNVCERSLREIVEGDLRRYWDLSFDKIEVCRDCEYRYACHDCRPITYGPTGELTAKSIHCSYDPYRGEWGAPA